MMNAVLLSQICVLLNLFCTPGIAGLITKKTPEKFLIWHMNFLTSITRGVSLPLESLISEKIDNPKNCLLQCVPTSSDTPIVTPTQIAQMSPTWNSVTHGGCPTDQIAISHLIRFVSNMV